MSRNLKALGLALAAMLAMGAMTAVQASANGEEHTEEGHIVSANGATTNHESSFVFGNDTNEDDPLHFVSPSGGIDCHANHFDGEIDGGTTKSLTLEVTFGATGPCTAGGFPATIDNNGCHLTFHHAETTPETTADIGEWTVTTDLHCPDGQPGVVVKAYSGGAHGFQVCQITVPPQTGLEGVSIHNNYNTSKVPSTPHDITATVDVKGIQSSQSGLCGSSETDKAEMTGEVTLEAFNEEEEQIDLFVEHTEVE